jgi:hypothetical protein
MAMRTTTGYPGKTSAERKKAAPRTTTASGSNRQRPQGESNSRIQITANNKSDPLKCAETVGNCAHERKNPG